MPNRFERRLSRLEKLAAAKASPPICNCRTVTKYHNATCLAALLKRMLRVCPLHDFRDLGYLAIVPRFFRLEFDDYRFCPCPYDPWRSLNMREEPHTEEERFAAYQASLRIPLPDEAALLYDERRARALEAEYWKDRRSWTEKTGVPLPSPLELSEAYWEEMRPLLDTLKRKAALINELTQSATQKDDPLLDVSSASAKSIDNSISSHSLGSYRPQMP
jgi:hypothetical protein